MVFTYALFCLLLFCSFFFFRREGGVVQLHSWFFTTKLGKEILEPPRPTNPLATRGPEKFQTPSPHPLALLLWRKRANSLLVPSPSNKSRIGALILLRVQPKRLNTPNKSKQRKQKTNKKKPLFLAPEVGSS